LVALYQWTVTRLTKDAALLQEGGKKGQKEGEEQASILSAQGVGMLALRECFLVCWKRLTMARVPVGPHPDSTF
jgi:hypothetical protein